jgi:hypothetical protein
MRRRVRSPRAGETKLEAFAALESCIAEWRAARRRSAHRQAANCHAVHRKAVQRPTLGAALPALVPNLRTHASSESDCRGHAPRDALSEARRGCLARSVSIGCSTNEFRMRRDDLGGDPRALVCHRRTSCRGEVCHRYFTVRDGGSRARSTWASRRRSARVPGPRDHKKAQRPRGGKPEPPCRHRPGQNARLY